MDLSGIQAVILKEYASSKGLLFENHLYGCFTVLEQFLDVHDYVLDCSFNQIGVSHGFLNDARASYAGSEGYQNLWSGLFSRTDLSDAFVDTLEDCIFDSMKDASSVYFVAALDSGELPEELLKGIEAVFAIKRKRLPRTRSKRAITPMQKPKGLAKTRRQKVTYHNSDTESKA
jgi:hypothetical protein